MAKRKRDSSDAPKSDVYVGLLALALLAQIVASVFLFLDYNNLSTVKLPTMPKFTWSGGTCPGWCRPGSCGCCPGRQLSGVVLN